jgi:hypothetical protein
MTSKPENGPPPPEKLYIEPHVWRGFLVCMGILAALLLAALFCGCTAPQRDAASTYSRSIEHAAELSAPVAPPGPIQDSLYALGAAAGAVVAALGAWKSHSSAKAAKASAATTNGG